LQNKLPFLKEKFMNNIGKNNITILGKNSMVTFSLGAIQHCSIKNFIQAFSSPKFFHHPFARIGSYCKSIKIFNWNSRESHPFSLAGAFH